MSNNTKETTPQFMLCQAIKKKDGKRCCYKSKYGDFCGIHRNFINVDKSLFSEDDKQTKITFTINTLNGDNYEFETFKDKDNNINYDCNELNYMIRKKYNISSKFDIALYEEGEESRISFSKYRFNTSNNYFSMLEITQEYKGRFQCIANNVSLALRDYSYSVIDDIIKQYYKENHADFTKEEEEEHFKENIKDLYENTFLKKVVDDLEQLETKENVEYQLFGTIPGIFKEGFDAHLTAFKQHYNETINKDKIIEILHEVRQTPTLRYNEYLFNKRFE